MTAQEMWNLYTQENPKDAREKYEAWYFGNSEAMANNLANLVISGEKTGTASALALYEIEKEALPQKNSYHIILDYAGNAKCIIKIAKVYTTPFCYVTDEHAFKEAEGDKTLEYWRKVHQDFFTDELKEYNLLFDENMLVVCEEFEIVFK